VYEPELLNVCDCTEGSESPPLRVRQCQCTVTGCPAATPLTEMTALKLVASDGGAHRPRKLALSAVTEADRCTVEAGWVLAAADTLGDAAVDGAVAAAEGPDGPLEPTGINPPCPAS
jgi:hypothetical protein